jgi:poly-gamma-glutamate synthase PgsB/CapB
MYVFTLLFVLVIFASILGIVEYYRHQKRIYSIPIRIHVNGTRGKSSVTRLIGAGLSEGGIRTITKVTGTYPRLILEDGTETAVYRKAQANIIEQLSIVKLAAERKAKAIVIECMALEPQYQWITETKMIHATIGVITNVRLDHVDIMGYTLPEIAEVLGETIPRNQHFFTSETNIPEVLKKISDHKKAVMHISDSSSVSDEEMSQFSYIEHKENVALALAVCEQVGVDRNTALKGMYKAIPDAGALNRYKVETYNKTINFYNAFAANDPQSTLMIWKKLKEEAGLDGTKIILLNTRHDRMDRARQLAEMVGKEIHNDADYLVLIGQSTEVVESMSTSYGFEKNKIVNVGWTEPSVVFENILSRTKDKSTVVSIGNIGGMGGKVLEFFQNRSNGYD